jgi:hypothetical protein
MRNLPTTVLKRNGVFLGSQIDGTDQHDRLLSRTAHATLIELLSLGDLSAISVAPSRARTGSLSKPYAKVGKGWGSLVRAHLVLIPHTIHSHPQKKKNPKEKDRHNTRTYTYLA